MKKLLSVYEEEERGWSILEKKILAFVFLFLFM